MKIDTGISAITQLTLSVFRLNGVLLHWGDRLVAPLGLTSARWQMLGAIALADVPLTVPQIGEVMGISRQGAQKQINLLQKQGLVVSQTNPEHRRSPLYALTPQGRALYLHAEALWTAHAQELTSQISAIEAAQAKKTLESMQSQLLSIPLTLENRL